MVHECDGGKKEVSQDGWSARFFNKIGQSTPLPISERVKRD